MSETTNKGLSPQIAPGGYDLVKFGAVTTTVDTETVQVPMATIRAADGSDATGTDGTGITQPTGGTGLLGWLSGIYAKAGDIASAVGGVLNIRALSGSTDSVAVSNLPAAGRKTMAESSPVVLASDQAAVPVSAAALPLPTGASTAALQTTGNAALSAIDVKIPTLGQKNMAGSSSVVLASDQSAVPVSGTVNLGTLGGAATAALQSTGNTELAAINTKLGGALATTTATKEDVSYFTGIAVIPSSGTAGLNYFWIRNTSATKKIRVQKIEVIMIFAGTAAATRSLYALKKFTGATATTGTVTLGAVPGITGAAASIADIKWAAAGGTLTGATVNASQLMQIGHANQLTANVAYDRSLVEAPIVLGQNEGLVLQSDGAVVVGSTVILSLRWTEE